MRAAANPVPFQNDTFSPPSFRNNPTPRPRSSQATRFVISKIDSTVGDGVIAEYTQFTIAAPGGPNNSLMLEQLAALVLARGAGLAG